MKKGIIYFVILMIVMLTIGGCKKKDYIIITQKNITSSQEGNTQIELIQL